MKNVTDDELLESFLKDYAEAIRLIEASNEPEARSFFNAAVFPVYRAVVNEEESILRPFLTFFIDMNEYLNNPAVKVSGLVTKDLLIGEYHSDFQHVLRDLRKKGGH